MKKLCVHVIDQQLVIQRNQWWYLSRTAVQAALMLILLYFFLQSRLKPHALLALRFQIAIIGTGFIPLSFFLRQSFYNLRSQKYAFDRKSGLFLLNDEVIWSTREFQSVRYQTKNAFHTEGLFIRTKSRIDFLIAYPEVFDTSEKELKETAKAIAEYLEIDLVIGEQFVPGRKRWGSKRLNHSNDRLIRSVRYTKRTRMLR